MRNVGNSPERGIPEHICPRITYLIYAMQHGNKEHTQLILQAIEQGDLDQPTILS